MNIGFLCPKCRAGLGAPEGSAGGEETCPECGEKVKVPREPGPPIKRDAVRVIQDGVRHDAQGRLAVTLRGIDVPFGMLVSFFAECAIAALPALLILALFSVFIGGCVRFLF